MGGTPMDLGRRALHIFFKTTPSHPFTLCNLLVEVTPRIAAAMERDATQPAME